MHRPLAARIKTRGGALESEPADVWGVRRAFRLRDPDGFRFTNFLAARGLTNWSKLTSARRYAAAAGPHY